MTGQWRVSVDSTLCIGSGMCIGTAPDRFRFAEDQRSCPAATLIDPDDAVRDAAMTCPVEAINVTDANTGDPVPLED